jgi:hypothetical protein
MLPLLVTYRRDTRYRTVEIHYSNIDIIVAVSSLVLSCSDLRA